MKFEEEFTCIDCGLIHKIKRLSLRCDGCWEKFRKESQRMNFEREAAISFSEQGEHN